MKRILLFIFSLQMIAGCGLFYKPDLNYSLIKAAERGDIAAVQDALEKGADINKMDGYGSWHEPALYQASYNGHIDVVKLLLDRGADVNGLTKEGKTALMAASRGYVDIVELLLDKGADVNRLDKDGETALMEASRRDIDTVKVLLDNGADVNKKDSDGRSAMSYAAICENVEVLKLLLEHGADIDSKGKAFRAAADRGYVDIAKLLLENGANINMKDTDGLTGLIYAADNGNTEMVRFLLENGADVHASDSDGITSLMIASWVGHTGIVKLLLENGADVHASDLGGVTSLMVASWDGHNDIVELLIKKGAQVKEIEDYDVKLYSFAYGMMIDVLEKIDTDIWVVPTAPVILGDMEQLMDVPNDQFQKMKMSHEKLCQLTDVYQRPKKNEVWFRKSDKQKVLFLNVSIEKDSSCWRCYFCDSFLSWSTEINTPSADIHSPWIKFDQHKGEFDYQEYFVLDDPIIIKKSYRHRGWLRY